MKNTLTQLEILIESFYSDPTHHNWCQLKDRIYYLCQKSKKSFIIRTHDSENHEALKTLVSTYQYNLIKILDDLYEIKRHNKIEMKENKCVGKVSNYFLALLSFLKSKYKRFFDFNAYVPFIELSKHKSFFETKILKITKHLSDKGFTQHLQILLLPLAQFITQKNRASYYQLKFLSGYCKNLMNYQAPLFFNETEEVIKILVSNNINTNETIGFIIWELEKITSNEVNKLIWLYRIQKVIKQYKPIQKHRFIRQNKPLKKNLSNWIDHEILYHKRLNKYSIISKDIQKNKYDFKVETKFSIAQIAYLIKLLIESGLVKKETKEKLFTIISENFTSVRSESIAISTLNSRYKEITLHTQTSIRNVLLKLIKGIK